VVDALSAILDVPADLQDDVFMKIGASSTVSPSTLYCFADSGVDLKAYSGLQPTLDHFLGGDAAGSTPFDRDTEAAVSGRNAGWAMDGAPSPVEHEISEIAPRLAIVHYGTNDMGLGTTYASALPGFVENMQVLLDHLGDSGIASLITGISPRGDSAAADLWVPTYNAVIRGLAQQRRLPFIDLWEATWDLDDHGLSGDGLHLARHPDGACLFTPDGLSWGYNVRNLIVLEALDRVRRVAFEDEAPPDLAPPARPGDGSPESPFVIDELPFVHFGNTSTSTHTNLDEYSCDDADESGPELLYRIELASPTGLRAIVMDRGDVDVDIHLLDSTAEDGCLARGHHMLGGAVTAGSYHLAVDTWVGADGTEYSGEYMLVVVECSPGDASCPSVN
jgi:hypothetical protein